MDSIDTLLTQTINIKEIPELPEYAKIAISSTLTGEKSIEQLIQTVRDSPSITLKLLKVANSPFYARVRPVSNIKDAIVLLGYKTVKSIIISITIRDLFQKKELEWFDYNAFILHSIAVATLCEEFAQTVNLNETEELYAAGILHDIGKIIFISYAPNEYEYVLSETKKKKLLLVDMEKEMFGTTHAEIGGFLLGLWGFRNKVVEAVLFHHKPPDTSKRQLSPLAVTYCTNALANELSTTNYPEKIT